MISFRREPDAPVAPLDGRGTPLVLLTVEVRGHTRLPLDDRTAGLHIQGLLADLLRGLEAELSGFELVHRELCSLLLAAPLGPSLPAAQMLGLPDLLLARLQRLAAANGCGCEACLRLKGLRFKVVIHAGEMLSHRHGRDWEISGLEATRHHRLTQSRLEDAASLLLTRAAASLLGVEEKPGFEAVTLELEGFGPVPVVVRTWDRPAFTLRTGWPARLWMSARKVLWGLRFR